MKRFFKDALWHEAALALLFSLALIALVIATARNSQTWIYQGF